MNCLEIKGLRKVYRKHIVALENVELAVPESCVFGLVGPNGAGKSTTMNILAGVVRRDAGEVTMFGERINESDFEYKRNVGFVLERPVYIEKLTAGEYLDFTAVMHGLDGRSTESHVQELLEFFELPCKNNELIETFSTGMKKKLSLAAAFVHRPRLLILDEPLEGVDPVAARSIKHNLRLMAERGATVFFSSHALQTVEALCDRVAVINLGRIVFQAKTEDIPRRIKDEVSGETYASLEEIFIQVTSSSAEQKKQRKLSWL